MSFDDIAIRVEDISKRFELYNHPGDQLKQFVFPRIRRAFGIEPSQYFEEFWALKNISFEVFKGEAAGIVGLNGSGKSTLLQIITGTLTPTTGRIESRGKIAALLELGAGFNQELTGRENIYLNGALLGFNKTQIDEKYEEIQAFADIGNKFDQPIKGYSSGMQVRVAFAVATAFDPEILIVDEALAVGDAYFQQKCFRRIERFKDDGGTILFVSHDANVVKQLCNKAILLHQGSMLSVDNPKAIIDLYEGLIAKKTDLSDKDIQIRQSHSGKTPDQSSKQLKQTWTKATTIVTNQDAVLLDFKFLNEDDQEIRHIVSEQNLKVKYSVKLNKYFERPAFGLIVRDKVGKSIFETSTYAMGVAVEPQARNSEISVCFVFNFNLREGQYSFSVGVANKGFSKSDFEEYSLLMHDVDQIQVLSSECAINYGGVFNMNPKVSLEILDNAQ